MKCQQEEVVESGEASAGDGGGRKVKHHQRERRW